MKKDELLGMEVYYEDNPKPRCCPAGHKGETGVTGVWVYGPPDQSKYDDVFCLEEEEEEDEFDSKHWIDTGTFKEDETLLAEPELLPVLPMRGRIYWVKELDVVAKLVQIRNLSNKDAVFEMTHHGKTFYVDPSDLFKASEGQVANYLEESD